MLDLYISLTYLSCIYFDLKHKFRVSFNNIGPVILSLALDQCNNHKCDRLDDFESTFLGPVYIKTDISVKHTLTFNNHYNFSVGFYIIHRNNTHFYI